jgi:hypothetical protein
MSIFVIDKCVVSSIQFLSYYGVFLESDNHTYHAEV